MSAARKLDYRVRKHAVDNTFSSSIDKGDPVNFKAAFAKVGYPQVGDPPRWTIEANHRNSEDNHIQTIRVIFFTAPEEAMTKSVVQGLKVTYSNTAEDPPSEYSTDQADVAIQFNAAEGTISGTISAELTDQLDPPKFHALDFDFNLASRETPR